jgi:predicted Zn finger-like uncharacterized protein
VIVTCERCETEFQLDEARVPEGGARVRCSRCKHAFFVMRPAASVEEQVDQAASLALADDPTPDVTEDLPDEADAPSDEPASVADAADPTDGADDTESDWEFNADLPADPGDSSPDVLAARAPASPTREALPADDEDDSALELAGDPVAEPEPAREPEPRRAPPEPDADLGTPLNWDFFEGGERPAAAPVAATAPTSAPTSPFVLDPAPEIAHERASDSARLPTQALRIAAETAGWLVTAGLCALVLWRGLAAPAPVATAWPEPTPGVAIEAVRGRWLETPRWADSTWCRGACITSRPAPPRCHRSRSSCATPAGRAVGPAIALRGAAASRGAARGRCRRAGTRRRRAAGRSRARR